MTINNNIRDIWTIEKTAKSWSLGKNNRTENLPRLIKEEKRKKEGTIYQYKE